MVVVTTATPSWSLQISTRNPFLRRRRRQIWRRSESESESVVVVVKGYMENSNSLSSFASKVIGALPVLGLLVRIASDEGGVGGDIIDFAEFRRRVGKKCSPFESRAFYDFQTRHGRAGDPLYPLMCCWLAAVGAGLLKSEEILEGAARLRISNDIEFEEETFLATMNEATEKRSRSKGEATTIPMEARVEKAVEAIYVCSFGTEPIEEEDERLLNIMLRTVFPGVDKAEISRIVKDRATKVSEGETGIPQPKVLSKEAVEMQMKDLQFLKQPLDN